MELQGARFGRLTVVRRIEGTKRVAWACVCACGNKVVKAQVDLRSGDTKSCGCMRREQRAMKNKTHGATNTTAYRKWKGMWARVRNTHRERNACYAQVSVAKRWEKFENFYADMGDPPEGYSLDRVDSRKGYSKANCRWVPLEEQARNTSRTRKYKGICMSQAARNAGLPPSVVFDRLNKLGWSVARALGTPKRKDIRCLQQTS